ncbi:MAG: AraC family transcriptional regulator [Bacteroidetes bacterium]|nr:AraC family transcriptional regulator [Bacteroidota bacterium]
MYRMQVSPSIELSGLVRHYLFLDIGEAAVLKLRLFSDGSTGIVFNSSSCLFWGGGRLPEAFLYGQITEYKEVYCQGPAQLAIVVFHSQGLSRLLNVPVSGLNNSVIPLGEIFGVDGMTLQKGLGASGELSEKVSQIEDFVRRMLVGHGIGGDPLVASALDVIQRYNGVIHIEELTGIVGCQPRQLERKFNAAVGLSPKHLCNIVRVHAFIKLLQSEDGASLTDCAYESGYYDQAHLIREFRKVTGLTPSQYIKKATPLAVNFLQL